MKVRIEITIPGPRTPWTDSLLAWSLKRAMENVVEALYDRSDWDHWHLPIIDNVVHPGELIGHVDITTKDKFE